MDLYFKNFVVQTVTQFVIYRALKYFYIVLHMQILDIV